MENGGERFQYIPCLNDRKDHIQFLTDLVVQNAQGWPEMDPSRDIAAHQAQLQHSADTAEALMKTTPEKA